MILQDSISQITGATVQSIFQCLSQGFGEDYLEADSHLGLITHVSKSFLKWDLFNRNLFIQFASGDILHSFYKRGMWELTLLYSHESNLLMSFMSKNRFRSIQNKRKKEWPLYLRALLTLNAHLQAAIEQQRFFEDDESENQEYFAHLLNMMCSSLGENGDHTNWRHALVVFDPKYNQISSLNAYVLDANMEIVEECNWLNVVKPVIPNMIETMAQSVTVSKQPILKEKALARMHKKQLVSLKSGEEQLNDKE